MSAVRIRPASLADLDGMLALENLFTSDLISRRSLSRFLTVPSARLWVAVQGHIVVGDVLLLLRSGADYGRVYSLVVAPLLRGQGLGERLIATAERHVRATSRSRLRLEVRLDNPAARGLYQKRGYVEVAQLHDYYEDGSPGLRLEKVLR